MESPAALVLDFHGVRVRVDCADGELRRRVETDFQAFRATGGGGSEPEIHIRARLRDPEYGGLPPVRASVYTPRNVCYRDGDTSYIDYFGRALCVYDRARERLDIASVSPHLLHEIVYLSVLSRVGERLERRRMHRVHALAVERGGEAALFLMPSGGGKTTLALRFLAAGAGYRLLSEDSPLVDARGRILPFPLRIGVAREEDLPEVPVGSVRRIERMEFGPKYLISLDAFPGRIATAPAVPRLVFVGDRSLREGCRIRPAGRGTGGRALLRHMVVGLGLYQGVEFLLQSSVADLLRKGDLFASRLLRAGSLLRRSRVFTAELGRDADKNASEILAFLEAQGFGRAGALERSGSAR